MAGTLPTKDLSPRLLGALQVFQLAIQRNPTDANAHFLLALTYQSAGRVSAAREALQNALKLRPGFPDAAALLAKLGPGAAPARKFRPAGSAAVPAGAALIAVPLLAFAGNGRVRFIPRFMTFARYHLRRFA